MKKITKKETEKIRKLCKEGVPLREIAEKFKVSYTTIHYHSKEENKRARIKKAIEKFRRKSLKERREIYQRRREYVRKYLRNKYETDEKYREKQKKKSREYYRKLKGGK